MGGYLFGYDWVVIGGAKIFYEPFFAIEDSAALRGWAMSSALLGCLVGAGFSGSWSDKYGRKKLLILSALLFLLSAVGTGAVDNFSWFIFYRIVGGLGIGIASNVSPIYIAEVSPTEIRGKLVSLNQLTIVLGILSAQLANWMIANLFTEGTSQLPAEGIEQAWRWMFWAEALPAALFFILAFIIPESPRWLASKGSFSNAETILSNLRETKEEVEEELKEIKGALTVKQAGWSLFKTNKNVRRVVFLGMLLMLMQQFTGINIIFYYAPTVFGLAGFTSSLDQMICTVLCGVVNLLATIIAMRFVDKLGRKIILKIGFSIISLSMIVLGICIYFITNGMNYAWIPFTAVAITLICITGFAMSAGPIMWTLCAEIQPLKSREFGIACSTATCWISSTILGATFLTLVNTLGAAETFWLYAILNIIFIAITILLIPETKGVSLEYIEKNLMEGKPLKNIGL